ncbi:MAG: hypothetical protein QM759_14615 [Terricaulis sp.]
MADLSKEIAAFERQLPVLKQRITSRRWVVFLGGECRGDFRTFSEAMEFGMSKFPEADFLVRQIDAPKAQLPFLMVVA